MRTNVWCETNVWQSRGVLEKKMSIKVHAQWHRYWYGFKTTLSEMVSIHLLLLLLSRSSCVDSATPQMAAHQAPLSLGFSRQGHCSGLPFPSPMHACMLSHFSRVRLCDAMDSSPPGSSVHGILQASIQEWAAISFSSIHLCIHNTFKQCFLQYCNC